jgi:hypothetical protein
VPRRSGGPGDLVTVERHVAVGIVMSVVGQGRVRTIGFEHPEVSVPVAAPAVEGDPGAVW